jgi:hypothetical protein
MFVPSRAAVIGALLAAVLAATAATAGAAGSKPIVTVTRHGGLCVTGSECRSMLRIDDTTISAEGFRPRRLSAAERTALLAAVGKLNLRYLKAHPFKGTCPIAYDGSEAIYRFRGFSRALPSCKYDLRRVGAVQIVERLLSSLRPA